MMCVFFFRETKVCMHVTFISFMDWQLDGDPDLCRERKPIFRFQLYLENHGEFFQVGHPETEIVTGGCAETWNKLAQNKLRAGDSGHLAPIWNWARSQALRRYLSQKKRKKSGAGSCPSAGSWRSIRTRLQMIGFKSLEFSLQLG